MIAVWWRKVKLQKAVMFLNGSMCSFSRSFLSLSLSVICLVSNLSCYVCMHYMHAYALTGKRASDPLGVGVASL